MRPSDDLFAVFIQLMNELSSFLVNALGLAVVAEEDEEVPPMVNPPPVLPLLLPPPLLFFETANAQVLAALMEKAIKNSLQFHKSAYERPKQPFVQSWKELYELILPNKKYTKEAAEILNATDA